MAYLLFFSYLLLFGWLAGRMPFFKKSGIPPLHLRLFFGAKIAAAIIYGYLAAQAGGGDTWDFHQYGIAELQLLQQQPGQFFQEIFVPGYQSGYGDLLGVHNSWWNDLDAIIMGKMLAFFHIASGSRYYINLIFFNFLILAGPVLLFKVARRHLPGAKMWVLYLPLLVPSVLFWASGIHKEGLLLLALGLVVWSQNALLEKNKITFKHALAFLTGLLVIFIFRNFVLLPLSAALAAWAISKKAPVRPWISFTTTFAIGIFLFFGLRQLSPKLDFPQAVADRQAAFKKLEGRSKVETDSLQPTIGSFILNAPQAFALATFRPLPTDVYNLRIGLAAAETILTGLLLLAAVPLYLKQKNSSPYFLFCLFFSFTLLLIIGYTVNFLGAIVRYRSLVYPFVMLPVFFALSQIRFFKNK